MKLLYTTTWRSALLFLFALTGSLVTTAQVHVRGYYRKNGTYVQPHQRTRPNHTVRDNYSYPGNYSPNPDATGNTPAANNSTSGNKASRSTSASTSSSHTPYLGAGKYRIVSSMNPPLRDAPDITGKEIYACPRTAVVVVLEDAGDSYCKAIVDGHTGYISKKLIDKPQETAAVTPPTAIISKSLPEAPSIWKPEEGATVNYLYKAMFVSSMDPPMRENPSIDAPIIYICPKAATVYILEDSKTLYWKVAVNGRVGYVSSRLLRLIN